MKQNYLARLLCAALLPGTAIPAAAFTPAAPGNLKADVNGIIADLSWDWGNAGEPTLAESFEADAFAAPWSVKNTYSFGTSAGGNWEIFSFEDYEGTALSHDGVRAALIRMAEECDYEDLTTLHQDEWLMVRPGKGAVYLDFWYYIYPELLEVGGYQDFPDHYYVKISRDNGSTWTELWDARWDMGGVDAVQQASLFLGEETDENTIVAFNAVSGPEESLYFLWTVDDVAFYAADEARKRVMRARAGSSLRKPSATGAMPLHRRFTPADGAKRAQRRVPESEWLNGGNITYRVYLDEKMVGDYLKTRHFTDYSAKDPGPHLYKVVAWSEAEDKEFEAAYTEIEVEPYSFGQPRNLKATYEEEEDTGKYTISATWEAPEGNLEPAYYTIYVNDKLFGRIDNGEELSVGQSGLYKGAYTFSVEACYTYPEGTSERIYGSVYPGTKPAPERMEADFDGGNVSLRWNAPASADPAPSHYSVWWGEELVCEKCEETQFVHENSYPGVYTYSVHAVYTDGSVSLPSTAKVTIGESPEPFDLWVYEQHFDNAHTPIGWDTGLVDNSNSVKDMYNWRFDNWFGIPVPQEAGFTGGFASISGEAAGMNKLQGHLESPLFRTSETTEYVEVSFLKHHHEAAPGPGGPSQFKLQLSAGGDDMWDDVADLTAVPDGKCTYRIPDIKDREFRVRWSFLSRNSGVAAIDDVVLKDSGAAGVDETAADDEAFDIYSADGMALKKNVAAADIDRLPAGLYILKGKANATKRLVRR